MLYLKSTLVCKSSHGVLIININGTDFLRQLGILIEICIQTTIPRRFPKPAPALSRELEVL